MLDSRQLRYFLAVAQELHFGRAADRLNIAQSALSRQIIELERNVGVRLLNRGRRSAISLTEAGIALRAEAELAVQQLDRAETIARRAARGEAGRIEVGYVLSAVLSGVLPRVLARFNNAHPDVQVQLVAMETPRQLEALRTGLLDVGFVRPRASYPAGVSASIIHRESLLLVVAASHPLANKRVELNALASENFIVPQFDESAGFIEHLTALAARGGFAPKLAFRVRDFVTAATMASAGYGVVLAPQSMSSIQMHNVVCKPIRNYDGMAELVIAHRASAPLSAAHRFVEIGRTYGDDAPVKQQGRRKQV